MRVLIFSVHSPFDFRYAEQHGDEAAMLQEIRRHDANYKDHAPRAFGPYDATSLSLCEFQDLCNNEEINLEDYFIYFYDNDR